MLFCCLIFSFVIQFVQAGDLEKSFYDGSILFTANVYKELQKTTHDNFVVSPFSAEVILALAQCGAKGETAEELQRTLQLPDRKKTKKIFKNVLSGLKRCNQPFVLSAGNKIYVAKNFTIKDDFRKIADNAFDSSLQNIDFSRKELAARIINQWVERQTEYKVHDLISANDLDELTKVILVNALYFKANWSIPFFLQNTIKADFYETREKIVKVDTMHESLSDYNYCENTELDAKFLEIAFDGDDATVVFVLPNDKEGLARLEKQIEKVFLPQNFSYQLVNISIPKFKIDSSVDFIKVLSALGVRKAFTTGEADFSGISDQKLVIDEIIQKTIINVNEKGVEAAAATYSRFVEYFGVDDPSLTFFANHPFMFYIKVNNLILFAGRVILPTY